MNRNKTKNKKKQRRTTYAEEAASERRLVTGHRGPPVVNLAQSWVMPTKIRTKLRFIDQTAINNVGLASASLRYIANGLYDVDPRVASVAIPGFTELMSLYQNYRVENCKTICQFISNETISMNACVTYNATTIFSTNSFIPQYYGNKFSKQKLLPRAGQITTTIVNQVNMSELWGDVSYYGSADNFMGTTATNPSQSLNLNIGITAQPGAVLTTGAMLYLTMEFIVEFSNVKLFVQ
jgi:hypothetical protein